MPPPTSRKVKSVVLLSGGLDSALNLALAARYRSPVLALTFDYGQRAARAEIRAARRLCRYYDAASRLVKLPWMRELIPSPLARKALPSRLMTVEAVWVPNRNGVLIAVAAAFAESAGAPAVVAGFNAEEAVQFPDNSAAFVAASNRALTYSTARRVRLISYTVAMNKEAIVRKATRLGVPLEYVYPCYGEGPRPCGRCASCRRAAAAFARAGRADLHAEVFGGRVKVNGNV